MQTKLSILFYIKRAKPTTQGLVPIYLRITVNGGRIETSTKRFIQEEKWSAEANRVKGSHDEARAINTYLDILTSKIYDHQKDLIHAGEQVTAEALRNKLLGVEEKQRMLVPVFEQHNKQMESLIGIEFAQGTLVNFRTNLKHLKNFLQWKFSKSDIEICKVNHAFVADFDYFLRSIARLANNATVKNIRNFGKIVRTCIANNWLETDPFIRYKGKMREVEIHCLDQQELDTIWNKTFKTERLNLVKDIFIFSCYTGLAYIEAKRLDESHINIGIDGGRWIFIRRQKTKKTGKLSKIPLLEIPEILLTKYKNHPSCKNGNALLPMLTNQKMNAYLKEIADVCGINKELTYHVARHTFATTVTLNNGVSLEAVSDMLGHSSLKQTQHYSKVQEKMISNEMQKLRKIYSSAENETQPKSIRAC